MDDESKNRRGGARKGAGRPRTDSRLFTFRASDAMARYIEGKENKTDFIKSCIQRVMLEDLPRLEWGSVFPASRLKKASIPFFDIGIVAATHSGFPLAFHVCPVQYTAQGVLALLVGEVCVVLVVYAQKRQSSFVMSIPYRKPHAVSCSVIIENVLQGMDVREVSALVAFLGMVTVDNVPLLVSYVHLFVMVDVAEVVFTGTVHQTGVAAPLRSGVAELQELVVCAVRANALDILQRMAGHVGDKTVQFHSTAQSAARKMHAACAVVKGGLVDKIGGNGTEVHRAQHG